MGATELYDATRVSWKVGKRRKKVQYALAVFEGIVREVYEVTAWFRSGSRREIADEDLAFSGVIDRDRVVAVARVSPARIEARHQIHSIRILNWATASKDSRAGGLTPAFARPRSPNRDRAHVVVGILRGANPGRVVAVRADIDVLAITEATY